MAPDVPAFEMPEFTAAEVDKMNAYAMRVKDSGGDWNFGYECDWQLVDGWKTAVGVTGYFVGTKGKTWRVAATVGEILSAWKQCAEYSEDVEFEDFAAYLR